MTNNNPSGLTRRALLGSSTSLMALAVARKAFSGETSPPPAVSGLKSMTADAKPISAAERSARLAKLQDLMSRSNVAALLVEAGSTLDYFTGVNWWLSERVTAAVIPAAGKVSVVTPFFERPSIEEMLQVPAEVHAWQEDESPYAAIAAVLSDKGMPAGSLAVDVNTRFFVFDAVDSVLTRKRKLISAKQLVRACRMFKSPAELALLKLVNQVTLAALRYVHGRLQIGMNTQDITSLMEHATTALGATPDFTLTLLNEASAFPHGSKVSQTVRDGSVVLMDCGCIVHGYRSDISRTWVFGAPTARQRMVWNTVKRGQEIALETARIGVPVGQVDRAVRAHYESAGWGKNYALPGLPHRTGHGIGLDDHEAPYLVRNDETRLEEGMCFSDEPGIYIPGEFGVRLEDCWHMTPKGPELFTPLAKSIDDPI